MGKSPLFSEFVELIVVQNKFLVLLYCGQLSLTTVSGIPNVANIFFKLLTIQMAVFRRSSSISNDIE